MAALRFLIVTKLSVALNTAMPCASSATRAAI